MKFLSIEKKEIFLWEKKIIHYTIQLNSLTMKDDVGGCCMESWKTISKRV